MKKILLPLLLAALLAACTSMEEKRETLMTQARDYAGAGDCAGAVEQAGKVLDLDSGFFEARLIIGRCAMREGKFSEAEAQFAQVLDLAPESIESIQSLARLALVRGDIAKASQYADKALALGDNSPDIMVLRAGILMQESKYADAAALFEQALQAGPNNEEAIVGLASALVNTGAKDKARELLESSLEKLSASREAAAMLLDMTIEEGDLKKSAALLASFQERGMADEAMAMRLADLALADNAIDLYVEILSKRLETNPDSLEARIRLADLETSRGRFDQALDILEAARIHTDTVTLARASVLARAGRMEEAMVVLNTLIADGKDSEVIAKARIGLAEVFMQRDLPTEAIHELDMVIAGSPGNSRARLMRGRVNFLQQRYLEAAKDFKIAAEADHNDYGATLALADAQNAAGNPDVAEDTITSLIARDPLIPQAYTALASLYLVTQNPDAALMALAIGKTAIPDDTTIPIAEAEILTKLKRFEKAEKLLGDLIKSGKNVNHMRLRLAAVHGAAGDHEKAAKQFMLILEDDPDANAAAEGRVKALIAAKKDKEALAFAEQRLKERPNDPIAAMLAGEAAITLENTAKAEAALRKAVELAPQWEAPLATLVQMYTTTGQHEAAISLCREVIAKAPDASGPNVLLAMLLDQQGRYPEAEREYRNALIKDQDNILAANNLAFLLTRHKPDSLRLREAEKLARHAANSNSPASFDTLGWVLHLMGRHSEAESNIRKAHETFADNPVINYHLAAVLSELALNSKDKAESEKLRSEAIALLHGLEKLKGNFIYKPDVALLLARLKKAS